jgi:hypothetical protein
MLVQLKPKKSPIALGLSLATQSPGKATLQRTSYVVQPPDRRAHTLAARGINAAACILLQGVLRYFTARRGAGWLGCSWQFSCRLIVAGSSQGGTQDGSVARGLLLRSRAACSGEYSGIGNTSQRDVVAMAGPNAHDTARREML